MASPRAEAGSMKRKIVFIFYLFHRSRQDGGGRRVLSARHLLGWGTGNYALTVMHPILVVHEILWREYEQKMIPHSEIGVFKSEIGSVSETHPCRAQRL